MALRVAAVVVVAVLVAASCGTPADVQTTPKVGTDIDSGIGWHALPAAPDDAIAGTDLGRANPNAPGSAKSVNAPPVQRLSPPKNQISQGQPAQLPQPVLPPTDRCSAPITSIPGKPQPMVPACPVE